VFAALQMPANALLRIGIRRARLVQRHDSRLIDVAALWEAAALEEVTGELGWIAGDSADHARLNPVSGERGHSTSVLCQSGLADSVRCWHVTHRIASAIAFVGECPDCETEGGSQRPVPLRKRQKIQELLPERASG
jgi:hypothetical protein